MQDTKVAMGLTVNQEAGGSNPSLAANEWNEEQGILVLQEFKPEIPEVVSIGLIAARDPEKKATLKRIFLDVLRSTGLIQEACKVCHVPKSVAFQWRYEDPEFQHRWDQITKAELLPHLEAEAFRRAMNGSDLLLMFLMKAYDRERFDDKAAEKNVTRPSIVVQIRDVDKSLVAISDNTKAIPAIEYGTGKLLNGKKDSVTVIDAEVESSTSSDGPSASTERAS